MKAYVLSETKQIDDEKISRIVGVFYTYAKAEQELNKQLLPVFQQEDIKQDFTIEEFEMTM